MPAVPRAIWLRSSLSRTSEDSCWAETLASRRAQQRLKEQRSSELFLIGSLGSFFCRIHQRAVNQVFTDKPGLQLIGPEYLADNEIVGPLIT